MKVEEWTFIFCIFSEIKIYRFANLFLFSYFFSGFIDREVFEGVEFPRPASPELLATIKEWEEDLSDITEEQVKAQLGIDRIKLAPTADAREEFFYDEDVEASIEAQEARELARGGRGFGRGRGDSREFGSRGG